MDSFEINKIIAAVLLTALIIIGIGKFTDILFYVEKPKESAYKIEGLEVAANKVPSGSTEKKVAEIVDIKALLALGDLAVKLLITLIMLIPFRLLLNKIKDFSESSVTKVKL